MQVGKKVNKNNICNLRKRTKYSSYQDALGNLCVCACSVMSESSRPHRLQPTRFLCPQDSPGKKNTGVGGHFQSHSWAYIPSKHNLKRYMHPNIHSITVYNGSNLNIHGQTNE